MQTPAGGKFEWAWMLVVLAGVGALYGFLVKPHVVGFEYDDGLYLMASEAIAHGQGPVLPYLVGSPALVKYPPLFPALLAPLWWLAPDFPGNIPWFKGLNILLALGFLALLWRYARDWFAPSANQGEKPFWHRIPHHPAGLLMLLMAGNMAFAKTATNLMSEPLYLLLFMLFLWALRHGRPRPIPLLLLAVALFYTRTLGLLAFVAVIAWQLLLPTGHAEKWPGKRLALFGAGCLLLFAPWFAWAHWHAVHSVFMDGFEFRPFNTGYLADFLGNVRRESPVKLYLQGWWHQLRQLGECLVPAVSGAGGFLMGLAVGAGLAWQGWLALEKREVSFTGCFIALHLLVLPVWVYYDQYDRLLLPVLPLILLVIIATCRQCQSGLLKAAIALFLAASVFFNALQLLAWARVFRGDALLAGNWGKHGDPMWNDFLAASVELRSLAQKDPGRVFWSYHYSVPYALYSHARFLDKQMILWQGQTPTRMSEVAAIQDKQVAVTCQWLRRQRVSVVVANSQLRGGTIVAPWDELTRRLVEEGPCADTFSRIFERPGIWLYAMRPQGQ